MTRSRHELFIDMVTDSNGNQSKVSPRLTSIPGTDMELLKDKF